MFGARISLKKPQAQTPETLRVTLGRKSQAASRIPETKKRPRPADWKKSRGEEG
jgi:hypothetical protein